MICEKINFNWAHWAAEWLHHTVCTFHASAFTILIANQEMQSHIGVKLDQNPRSCL